MADIIQRGNPSTMKDIFNSAKKVSQSRNDLKLIPDEKMPTNVVMEGGAFASMQRAKMQESQTQSINQPVTKVEEKVEPPVNNMRVVSLGLKERLLDSLQTVGYTKEYYNAIVSMFTLYTMNELDEEILSSLKYEDIKEIKSIIRDFKSFIDTI